MSFIFLPKAGPEGIYVRASPRVNILRYSATTHRAPAFPNICKSISEELISYGIVLRHTARLPACNKAAILFPKDIAAAAVCHLNRMYEQAMTCEKDDVVFLSHQINILRPVSSRFHSEVYTKWRNRCKSFIE
jgi:hypothetical protein